MNNDDTPLEVTAYHEAGHIVVASVLGMALKSEGVTVWEMAQGETFGAASIWEDERDWERTLIFLRSGVKAQLKQFPQFWTNTTGLSDDCGFFRIVREHFGDRKNELKERIDLQTDLLLDKHWSAVEAIAQAVTAGDWKPAEDGGIEAKRKKQLDGLTLAAILEKHGIPAVVR